MGSSTPLCPSCPSFPNVTFGMSELGRACPTDFWGLVRPKAAPRHFCPSRASAVRLSNRHWQCPYADPWSVLSNFTCVFFEIQHSKKKNGQIVLIIPYYPVTLTRAGPGRSKTFDLQKKECSAPPEDFFNRNAHERNSPKNLWKSFFGKFWDIIFSWTDKDRPRPARTGQDRPSSVSPVLSLMKRQISETNAKLNSALNYASLW